MPQQKPVKKRVAPRASASKAKPSSVKRGSSVRVGSGKKNRFSALTAALFNGRRKWITLAVLLVVFGGPGAYMIKQSSAVTLSTYGCTTYPLLYRGISNKPCVQKLQNSLNVLRGERLSVDGVYGDYTYYAVRRFQSAYGLYVDGKVGDQTWSKLRSLASYGTTTTTNVISSSGCPSGTVSYGAKDGYQSGVRTTITTCGISNWPASFPNSAGQYIIEVNSKIAQETANMAAELKAAANAGGWSHTASSGFRAYYQQQCIYNYYKTGVRGCSMFSTRPSAAASPGYSNHQMGYSIDLPTGYTCSSPSFKSSINANKWLNANMGRFGFSRDVGCGDYGHMTNKP